MTTSFPWNDIWAKNPKTLSEAFPSAKSEDFLYFPLTGVPQSPLPQASLQKEDIVSLLDLLEIPKDQPYIFLGNGGVPILGNLPEGFSCISLKDYDLSTQKAIQQMHTDYFKALSLLSRSQIVQITLETPTPFPIHLILAHTQEGSLYAPQVILDVQGPSDKTVLLHTFSSHKGGSPSLFLPYIQVRLAAQARLSLVQSARSQAEGSLFSYLDSVQEADTHLDLHLSAWEGHKTRLSIGSVLTQEGASFSCDGAALIQGSHQCEFFARVLHQAPRTFSSQFFKAIARKGGHFSFNGDIFVAPMARGVEAVQLSKNLLLDKHSRVFARPTLHVEHNDLKCSHGATIGGLSEEERFYLQSRGISEPQSAELLMSSFLGEILDRFPAHTTKFPLPLNPTGDPS